MKIETKFSIGDRVWKIVNSYVYKDVPCPTCNESGNITIGGEVFVCPKCKGRKLDKRGCHKWILDIYGGMTVGQVRYCRTGEHRHGEAGEEEGYMCDQTGIGSGTVHNVADLFGSREEALAECERRNAGES